MANIVTRALLAMLSCLLILSCKPSTNTDGDNDADLDISNDADPDVEVGGNEDCIDNSDCDDGVDCTEDLCGAGNLCRNIPFDERCPGEQVCRERRGCVDGDLCDLDEDCDDGDFCNGDEQCVGGGCFAGTARTCDDGDDCTTDYCNVATDSCVHDPAPDCVPDGGPDGSVEPFDPDEHYSGSFELLPHPNSACLGATFNILTVTLSSTPDVLNVQAGSFPMTQTPRPTDESFDVTHTQGSCGAYRLAGTFTNSDIFTGRWTATFSGGCSMCDDQDFDVTGVRSP